MKQILRTDITCTRVHARAREWNIDRREQASIAFLLLKEDAMLAYKLEEGVGLTLIPCAENLITYSGNEDAH